MRCPKGENRIDGNGLQRYNVAKGKKLFKEISNGKKIEGP
jgi:hypothetical protein